MISVAGRGIRVVVASRLPTLWKDISLVILKRGGISGGLNDPENKRKAQETTAQGWSHAALMEFLMR